LRYTNKRKNNKAKSLLIYVSLLLIIIVGVFIYISPSFEKNSPKLVLKDDNFWNLTSPLRVNFSDDTEIKSYTITYKDDENEVKLDTQVIKGNKNSVDLNILPPKFDRLYKATNVSLLFEVSDNSKWNFFMGNKLTKEVKIHIDKKKPIANVINNSYLLRKGGSASVVVEVNDENLKDFYISFNNEERFELIPFYKENFYMAIIAWPMNIEEFNRVNLIAIDKAKNKTTTKVPLYIKSKKIKIDKMKISDNFINKVSKTVLSKSGFEIPEDKADIFVKGNRELRDKNVKTIKDKVRKNMNLEKVSKFTLKKFRQLPGAKTFAHFGERRHYYYEDEKIDEAWHLGIDWASIRKAKVFTSNEGKVIFKDYLGIYGNTLIIDHKYGLSSLYAHTSSLSPQINEYVNAKQQIGNTGSTGAVFGDHLHFGILVQGIEVNPQEWMDKYWIRENITKVINQARKVIKSK